MQNGLACATCHGQGGRGGTVQIMMQAYEVPNITWPVLTSTTDDRSAYNEVTAKRAITEGLDADGGQLEYPMPRWQMSDSNLNDLVGFIKTLQ